MLRMFLMDWLANKKNRKRIMWLVPLLVLGSAFGGDQVKAILKYVLQVVSTGTLPATGPVVTTGPATPTPSPAPAGPTAPAKPVPVTPVSRTTENPGARPTNDGPVRVYFSRPGPQAQDAG